MFEEWATAENTIRCRWAAEGSAMPLMSWGWLKGREWSEVEDGARPQRGVCRGRTDTGTCAIGHVAHGRRHLDLLERGREEGNWVSVPPLLAKLFLEVAARGQQRYQCFTRVGNPGSSSGSRYRLRTLRILVGQLPLTVLKWRRRLLCRNNTGRDYFLLQLSTSAEGAR